MLHLKFVQYSFFSRLLLLFFFIESDEKIFSSDSRSAASAFAEKVNKSLLKM